jgi:hypothetical protein
MIALRMQSGEIDDVLGVLRAEQYEPHKLLRGLRKIG